MKNANQRVELRRQIDRSMIVVDYHVYLLRESAFSISIIPVIKFRSSFINFRFDRGTFEISPIFLLEKKRFVFKYEIL